MQIYQVIFDCITITLIAENANDMFNILKESNENFNIDHGKLCHRWHETLNEECQVDLIPMERGIIHTESH